MLMRGPESLRKDFSAIKSKMDQDYTNNLSLWSIAWTQGNIDIRLEAGDPSLMAQLYNQVLSSGTNSYYFNRVRPICNMISGYQRRKKKKTVFITLKNFNQKKKKKITKILLHIYKKE